MVIPRTSLLSAAAFSEIGSNDFGATDHSSVVLLVCTSMAFLLPARTSFLLGRFWHAWVFLMMAVMGVIYHMLGSSTYIGSSMKQHLMLAHHGWACFCFLQVAFLILGPEDPHMQWIDHPIVLDVRSSSLMMATPFDAILLARVLPIGALVCFLCMFSSTEEFHWKMIVLGDTLLLFGCFAFWMHRNRRSSMPKVLLRFRFWKRLWNHCALPILLASFIWAVIESTDSHIMNALWHVLLAVLATSIIKVVARSSEDMHKESEIMDVSPQNPVVVKVLLASMAFFGLPTIVLSLVMDWVSVGYWRWPLICKATGDSAYFVVIGALPTLMAQASTFWLVSSTLNGPLNDPEEVVLSKQFGCIIGYISVVFGLLTLAIPDSLSPSLRSLCMVMFLCLTTMAILLTTLSARNLRVPGMRSRYIITFFILVLVTSFLTLLILVQQYIPNSYSIPHWLLAVSEYATLALPTLWPLTWGEEVQTRWQTHKAWRSFRNHDFHD